MKPILTEGQLRTLLRLAHLMRSGETGEVGIKLKQGGVIDYRESRSYRPQDMDPSDSEIARELGLA